MNEEDIGLTRNRAVMNEAGITAGVVTIVAITGEGRTKKSRAIL
jgi:hypothetical protein